MNLEEFIKENDLECSKNLINTEQLHVIEKGLNSHFGSQLVDYIMKYGYLAYEYLEFYGITSNQLEKSDLVQQTKYIHEYYDKTKGFVAIESLGEGIYAIVSESDYVFIYDSVSDKIQDTGKKLFDYIYDRLSNI